jgi:hypothetical protein
MIESWKQFFDTVSRMREHQKVYFQTNDPVALGMAKKLEKLVDDCIKDRKAIMDEKNKNREEARNEHDHKPHRIPVQGRPVLPET